MSAVVIRGDARSLPLPDASVDLIVTSPPYWSQRDYRDGGESLAGQIGSEDDWRDYLVTLLDCTREWMRVLKPSGSMFVNLGDKYANDAKWGGATSGKHVKSLHGKTSIGRTRVRTDIPPKSLVGLPERYMIGCIDDLGLVVRRDNIWHKISALPESVEDRCATRHEYVYHITRLPSYYAAIDEIREPQQSLGERHNGRSGYFGAPAGIARGFTERALSPLGKLPGSVWEIASAPLNVPEHIEHGRCCGGRKRPGCEAGLDHHAAFPPALPRKCILGWSPPGICLECGEGRRPVTSAQRTLDGQPRGDLPAWAPPSAPLRTPNGVGHWRFATDRRHLGYACACTPFTSHRGKRGDWKTGREEMPEHLSDDWHSPGNAVPRRPGGFGPGGKNPPPQVPEREYHFDGWTPAPTRPALVVDPFGGTGTTALVASVLGRNAITVDRSAGYCRLATWRINDPGERARALGVAKPPPVPEGQSSLFDDLEAS